MATGQGLTPDQRQTLVEQFIEADDKSQDSFDSSVRALSSAGVAATVALGVALEAFGRLGLAAAAAFLLSLIANLFSYVTARRDMHQRIDDLRADRDDRIAGTGWKRATEVLNAVSGVAFTVGGGLLAWFIFTTT